MSFLTTAAGAAMFCKMTGEFWKNITCRFSKMWQCHTDSWLTSLEDVFVLLKRRKEKVGFEELT